MLINARNVRGVINTWGVFQTYYERELLHEMSPSAIAWIGSLQSALLMLVGVISGPLFDAGYFFSLLGFGAFMLTFGLMMTSIASKFWQLILAQGFCVGLAAGCLFVPSVAILPQYFRKRRGLANGIAATGSSVGAVVCPIIFDQVLSKSDFAWATRALGFLALGTCAISLSVMRMRFKPKERRKLIQLSAFKEPTYVVLCFGMFVGFLGFYNFLVYIQPYALSTGTVSPNLGNYLLAILNAASTFGRVTPNFVADTTGPLNMLVPAVSVSAILAFAWIRADSAVGIAVLAGFYGFFSGGYVSLPPVLMASLTKDMRHLGTRLGMMFGIVAIGLLVGTPIGGAILNRTGSYLGVQLFTGCCLATSAVVFASLRLMRTGPKLFVVA